MSGNAGAQGGFTLGFAALGAIIGTIIAPGAGTMWGFSIGSLVGGISGRLLFPIEQPTMEGPRLNDLQIQGATYGVGIPLVYGTVRLAGNVIWATEIIEHATQESAGGGGKGGKDGATVTTYTYSISLAIGLCQGPIAGVRRVWANNELVFDLSQPAPVPSKAEDTLINILGAHDPSNRYLQSRTRLYKGTETQEPDPLIQATEGVNNTPAFRGLAYVVLENLQLSQEFHNVPPNFEFEVVVDATQSVDSQALLDSTVEPGRALGLFFGFLAIDPETGYIWATRSGNGFPGEVWVINPATWTLVKRLTGFEYGPWRITYQPRYFYRTLLGIPQEEPASMWVGGYYPKILGGQFWRIDTHTYEVTAVPVTVGAHGFYPANVWFDIQSVNPFILNENPGRLLLNDANGFDSYQGIDPTVPSNPIPTTATTSTLLWPVADGAFRDDVFWGVDYLGRVFKGIRSGTGTAQVDDPDGDDFATVNVVTPAGSTGVNMVNRLAYNPDEQCVYALTAHTGTIYSYVTKLDSNLNQVWQRTYAMTLGDDLPLCIRYHEGVGDIWLIVWRFSVGLIFQRLDLTDGSVLEEIVTDIPSYGVWDVMLYPGQPYAAVVIWSTSGAGVYQTPLFYSPTPTPPTIEDIVRDLSIKAGFDPSDLETSALADETVDGFVLSDRISVRRAIEPLQRCYYFDAVESDYLVKFARRGNTPLRASIPFADLAARKADTQGDSPGPAPFSRSRVQDSELPHHIDVRYMDKDRLYKTTTQYSRRLIGHSDRSTTINLPIVCSGTKAKEVVDIALFAAWIARDRGQIVVNRKYLYLDPGDVIEVEEPEGTWTRCIIVKTDYNIPGMISLDLMRDEDSMYSSDLPEVPGPALTQDIRRPVSSRLFLMDIPILKDQDDHAGLYYTFVGLEAGWTAGSVWRSADDAATWQQLSASSTEGQAGYADTTLTFQGGSVEP